MKYYLIAVEGNNSHAMMEIAVHHKHHTKDYDNMIKYYIMAAEQGELEAMDGLYQYYVDNNKKAKAYSIFSGIYEKHSDMAITYMAKLLIGDIDEIIAHIQTTENIKRKNIDLQTENAKLKAYIDELELLPEGKKYKEVKDRFENNALIYDNKN
jgi:hypothetical protein